MNKPHKHAEVIKAWADGAQVECHQPHMGWGLVRRTPLFREDREYRVYDPMREFKEAYKRGEKVEVFYKGTWQNIDFLAMQYPHHGDIDFIFCLEVVTKNPLRIAPKSDYKENQTWFNAGGGYVDVAVTFDGETNKPKSVELVK